MATGVGAKILKGILIGGGSILSILSGGTLIPVGAALIAAGAGISIPGASGDPVNNAAANLQLAWNSAGAMSTAGSGGSVINLNSIVTWVRSNMLLIGGGLFLIFVLPKILKRK